MRSLEFNVKALEQGLAQASARGSLLRVEANGTSWYLFNTSESRKALVRIEREGLALDADARPLEPVAAEFPNIFRLYEQNIGPLTPLIVDELKEAEAEYPPSVIEDAFRIATENNARKWSYVRAILKDWARGNKHETTRRPSSRERRPAITGKLADVAKSK
jgi:DnaD/phage-associated family protein